MYNKEQENHIAQIKTLFESKEDENIVLGLEILEGLKLFQPLLTHLLIIALYADKLPTRAKAESLLYPNLSSKAYQFVEQVLQNYQYQEESIEKNYNQLQKFEELDANLFALLTLHFTKLNGKLCFQQKVAPPKVILQILTENDFLSLAGYDLEYLPEEIGDFKHLTSLDISENQLLSLPNSLQNLKKIETLYFKNCSKNSAVIEKLEIFFPQILAQEYYYEANNLIDKDIHKYKTLALLQKAHQLDPKDDDICFRLAYFFSTLKKYDEAITYYEKTRLLKKQKNLTLTGDYLLTLGNEALILNNLGKQEETIHMAHRILSFTKKFDSSNINEDVPFVQGIAYYLLNDYEKSKEANDAVIQMNPHYVVAWYNKACIYAIQHHKEKMLEHLKKAISLDRKFLKQAKKDKDFATYFEDKDFQTLIHKA